MTDKDNIILFDDNAAGDMFIIDSPWQTSWSDDFLGWLGLSGKKKSDHKPVIELEEEREVELDDTEETIENEEISWSVDATVIRHSEKQERLSRSRNEWFNKPKFSEWKYNTRPKKTSSEKPAIKKEEDNDAWSKSRFDNRDKHATWQKVVFNKIGWQKIKKATDPKTKKPVIESEYKVSETIVKKDEASIPDRLTVKEFAEKIWVPIWEVIKRFLVNNMMLSLNSDIDFDTAALIAMDFDIKLTKQASTSTTQDLIEWNLQSILDVDRKSENKQIRPPIVTIMWHVDHGKTSLLDYLRKTAVVDREHGGITQSIWWSQISHNGNKVTFIDTPGHELFTSLRARWSKITDIVVIVIAADDGVMRQTTEAINHAKDAKVPIIIAITKIDKGIDNTEFIKTQLSEHGLIADDRGGDVPIVKISSKTGEGIDDLMDNIVVYSELADLQYDPTRAWVWVILEARKDIQKWVVTNVILMTGELKVGDAIWAYDTFGKVKKLYNRSGKEIKNAQWGDPVMILGLQNVPEAGRLIEVVKDEKIAKDKIQTVLQEQWSTKTLSSIVNKISEWVDTKLNLIIKADSWGSLEALKMAIANIEIPENIEVKIVHSDIGNFFDSDIDFAKASDSILIWFGVDVSPMLKNKIDNMWLTIKNFKIIYEIIDFLEWLVKWLIKHDPVEVEVGKLEVLGVFFRKWNETIFGGKVTSGKAKNGAYIRVFRWEELIDTGKITSLQKEQTNVDEMWTWHECGMKAKIGKKIEVWDTIEFFVME